MFEIDKSVPPPSTKRNNRYPFHKLSVGESFFVPNGKRVNISNSAYACSRSSAGGNKRFVVKQVDGGVRCWRVE